MSVATSITAESDLPSSSVQSFTDWKPEHEKEPSEEQERKARERTLEIGNRTEIHWRDNGDWDDSKYKRLDLHNRDCAWEYREDVDTSANVDNQTKRHSVRSISGDLGLNSLQRRKVTESLFELDLPKFGMRTDVVSFCLCGLLLKQEAERYGDKAPYHPSRNSDNNDHRFTAVEEQLIESHGPTNKRYVQKVWGKLSQGSPPTRQSENWEPFVRDSSQIQSHPSFQPEWTDCSTGK